MLGFVSAGRQYQGIAQSLGILDAILNGLWMDSTFIHFNMLEGIFCWSLLARTPKLFHASFHLFFYA